MSRLKSLSQITNHLARCIGIDWRKEGCNGERERLNHYRDRNAIADHLRAAAELTDDPEREQDLHFTAEHVADCRVDASTGGLARYIEATAHEEN